MGADKANEPKPRKLTELESIICVLDYSFKHSRDKALRKKRLEQTAERLYSELGGIIEVLTSPPEVLEEYGLKDREITRLKIILTVFTMAEEEKYGDPSIDDEESLIKFIKLKYMGFFKETMCFFPIVKGHVKEPVVVAYGDADKVEADHEQLMRAFSKCRGCKEFLIVHNHPNASSRPSKEDITATEYLNAFFYEHDKVLKDHYVIGNDGVTKVDFDRRLIKFYLEHPERKKHFR